LKLVFKSDFELSHAEYLADLRLTIELYHRVFDEYAQIKTRYSLLDFDDLIERLQSLLKNPTVRERLGAQFRHFLIDEFQDTDRGQLELVTKLTENLSGATRITIVGDPKQSIYGFRNADPKVFSHAKEAMAIY